MALALGTNCGFVSVAPSGDPGAGTFSTVDNYRVALRHTSPIGAVKIVEVGWYCIGATEESNFEVGLYAADGASVPGEAGTRLYVDNSNAKGTDAGWKRVTVDWSITAETVYWIAMQCDATDTATTTPRDLSGGAGIDLVVAASLADPFGGGALSDADAMLGIYALYETGGGTTAVPQMMMMGMG